MSLLRKLVSDVLDKDIQSKCTYPLWFKMPTSLCQWRDFNLMPVFKVVVTQAMHLKMQTMFLTMDRWDDESKICRTSSLKTEKEKSDEVAAMKAKIWKATLNNVQRRRLKSLKGLRPINQLIIFSIQLFQNYDYTVFSNTTVSENEL